MKKTIGLACGGTHLEHEVSLLSSKNVKDGLNPNEYDVVVLAMDKLGEWHFSREDDYLFFSDDIHQITLNLSKPIVHLASGGNIIERSTQRCLATIDVFFSITNEPIQDLLRSSRVPYVGADIFGSCLIRDKDITKRLLRDGGLPVVPFLTLSSPTVSFQKASQQLGLPLFIKPARQGSSLGVFKVSDEAAFNQALAAAFKYDRKVLIEEAIEGKEIECAVAGNETAMAAHALCEVINPGNFYSYEEKYTTGNRALSIPAEIDETSAQKIRDAAIRAFTLLECEGMGRVDFFLQPDGSFFINEVATTPCLGKGSMYPQQWEASEVSYSQLIEQLINFAIDRHRQETNLKTTVI